MTDAPLTISMLGGLETAAHGLPITPADREELAASLRDRAREFRELSRHDLGQRLLEFVGQSLRKPVVSVLGEAWSQRRELRALADKGSDRRDVESEVELYEHTMTCELHPSVELQLDGVTVGTMTFDIALRLALEGVKLVIRNACITSIKAGTVTTTLSLEYEGVALMPPRTQKVDLPGSVDLPAGGINLGGSAARPPS